MDSGRFLPYFTRLSIALDPHARAIAVAGVGLLALGWFTPFHQLSYGMLVLALSLVVACGMHEGAHALVSRLLGTGVVEIGMGLGPSVASRSFRGVTYRLRLLPLGAYVKPARMPDVAKEPLALALLAGIGPVSSIVGAIALCYVVAPLAGLPIYTGGEIAAAIGATSVENMGQAFAGMTQSIWSFPMGGVPTLVFGAGAVKGLLDLVLFTAMLSLGLGIVNLLPISVTDGGLVYAALRRRLAGGWAADLLVAVVVIVNLYDLARWIIAPDWWLAFAA